MHGVLIYSILSVLLLFTLLTLLIVAGKIGREAVESFHRRRRRAIEPAVLAYAHGNAPSLLPALGGRLGLRDRNVLETVLLDHAQRVRGIERERIGRALDELGYVDRHLEDLASSRWWKRADGAEKLGLAGAGRAAERLIAAMRDEVPEVRIRSAKALGAIGGQASVRPLIEALREPNRWSTIRIADILAGIGRGVAEEIVASFSELNLPARLAALDILGRIRSLEAVPWLRDRVADPHPDVRARACHALGAIGEPGSGPALEGALGDDAWPVRAMAAKALGRLPYRPAIPALAAAARDREWWVRANAAEALRRMGPEGVAALDRLLDDPDVYARHQAVLMLQEVGEVDRRVDALAAENAAGREAAVAWLRRLVAAGQTGRLSELESRHSDPRVRAALGAMLAEPPRPADGATGRRS